MTRKTVNFGMSSWRNVALFFLSILALQTAILINVYRNAAFPVEDSEFPRETVLLFNSYDTNADGVIDLWEFDAVEQRINEAFFHTVRSKSLIHQYTNISQCKLFTNRDNPV